MIDLRLGDCRDILPTLADASVDCVVCDPPYPHIRRPYGTLSEVEWHALMDRVVPECRRVLKQTGSAVFILQPNSERVGRMRLWLWEFMVKWGREWGIVQDAYWWNTSAMPMGGATRHGLMRPSLKYEVWLGPPDAYRDQAAVFKSESASNRSDRLNGRFAWQSPPSRIRSATEAPRDDYRRMRTRCVERGGTTPFNVRAIGSDGRWSGGTHGHGASTPLKLCSWWLRYICPPGGTVLDPFSGSGTVALAAFKQGKSVVGIESMPEYHAIASRRIAAERDRLALLEPATP